MEIAEYKCPRKVVDCLENSGLNWLATGRFGMDIVLGYLLTTIHK